MKICRTAVLLALVLFLQACGTTGTNSMVKQDSGSRPPNPVASVPDASGQTGVVDSAASGAFKTTVTGAQEVQEVPGFQPTTLPPEASGAVLNEKERKIEFEPKNKDARSGKNVSKTPLPKIEGKVSTGLIGSSSAKQEKSPFAGDSEKQRVVLNFDKADLGEVSSQIFGDYLKLNYVIDQGLQGRISMYLEGDFTREELFKMVTRAYEANNVSIVPRKGVYYIQSIQRSASSSLSLADELSLHGDKGVKPVVVIYRLRYMDGKQAINTVRFFLTPGRPIAADPLTNSVVFVEDTDNAQSIVDILRTLDVNILKEVSMEIVPLKAISAQEAVQNMENMMNKLTLIKESSLKNNVAFIPLPSFGGVLILAQNQELLKTAKYWLTALDTHGAESGDQVYVYFVQNGLARDLADILNQVFGLKSGGTSGRPDQQIVKSKQGGSKSSFGGSSGSSSSFGGSSAFGTSSSASPTGSGMLSSSKSASSGSSTGGTGTSTQSASSQRAGGTTGAAKSSLLSSEVSLIADEVNNAVVIRANAADYARIKKTIETLDILPRAVLIEVMVAEISLTKGLEYGVQWYLRNVGMDIAGKAGSAFGGVGGQSIFGSTTTPGTLTNSTSSTGTTSSYSIPVPADGGSLFWGTTNQKIAALITMLASKTNVNILSRPTLLATDNKEASITVGGRQPVPTGTSVSTTETVSTIQYEETGLILGVTPHINAGGLVRLELEQTMRDVGADATVGNNNTAPTFTERNIKTTLLAQSGATVIIGGMITQKDDHSRNGVPYLQDIPLLGNLFSTTKQTNINRQEILIAITPHVVDNRDNSATHEFLDRLKEMKRHIGAL